MSIASDKKKTTCAVVNVEDITYLYNPVPKQKPPTTASTPLRQGNLRDNVRARAATGRKQHEPSSPSGSHTNTDATSSPSSSQTVLGKRKAASSEDEVDERV